MPSKKSKVATKAKSKTLKGKKEVKVSLGLMVLIVMGILLFADLMYMVKLWATPPKNILVQPTLTINGESTASGVFKCWDAVTTDKEIWFTDQPNNRILIFDTEGNYRGAITNKEAGKPDFKELSCITRDLAGNVYCIDTWNNLIRGFSAQRKPLPIVNIDNKGFFGARGLAYSKGYFFVADTGSQRIAKVSPEGDVVSSWGHHGSGKLEFDGPIQVVMDDQGRSYVSDKENQRIQCLDSNGKFVWEVSVHRQPAAEAVDNERHLLYVSNGEVVNVYGFDGKLQGVLSVGPKSNDAFSNITALSVFPNGDLLTGHGNTLTIYHMVPVAAPTSK